MKFILPVIAFFLLCSCAGLFYTNPEEQIYGASEVKVDFFEEWGLFRITGYGVVSKRAGTFVPGDSSFEKVCRDIHSSSDVARFVLNDRLDVLMIECYYQPPYPINTDWSIDNLVESMLPNHNHVWVKNDSLYHVLYGGDSVHIISGVYYNHKKVCAEKEPENCIFDADFEKIKNDIYFDGPFYEISLPATGAVRSLTIRTNPKDLEGYKPLKLDPSILPLESPSYKKLREQEEALSR